MIGFHLWVELIFRSSDTLFYEMPRFVTHIDDQAISALTKYYSEVLPSRNTPGVAILDMCSSWVRYLLHVDLSFPEHVYMIINCSFLSRSVITLLGTSKKGWLEWV